MQDVLTAIAVDLVALVIASLLIAVVTQTACRVAIRVDPPFGTAYKAVLVAGLAAWLLSFTGFQAVLADQHWAVALLVGAAIDFALRAAVFGKLIRDAKGEPIGFMRGLRVALIVTVIFSIVYAVFAAIFGAAVLL